MRLATLTSRLCDMNTQGWPRLMVQVWQLDTHGRNVLRGYGFRHLPSTPGFSEVSVPCWRPSGTMQVRVKSRLSHATSSTRSKLAKDVDFKFRRLCLSQKQLSSEKGEALRASRHIELILLPQDRCIVIYSFIQMGLV